MSAALNISTLDLKCVESWNHEEPKSNKLYWVFCTKSLWGHNQSNNSTTAKKILWKQLENVDDYYKIFVCSVIKNLFNTLYTRIYDGS